MAAIRELEQLGAVGASLQQLRVVVGQFGGLGPLARQVAQRLRQDGAKVITADELDPSIHAAAANRYAATVYIGFEPRTDDARRRSPTTPPPGSSRPAAARWPSGSRLTFHGRAAPSPGSAPAGCAWPCSARPG